MVSQATLQREAKRFKLKTGLRSNKGRIVAVNGSPYGQLGYAWVEIQVGPNRFDKPVQILNQTGIYDTGAYVRIGLNEENEAVIIGIDAKSEIARGSDPANTSVNKEREYVDKSLLTEFACIPIGSTEVGVGPGFLPDGRYFAGAQTTTLNTAISGLAAGEHQLAVVYVLRSGVLETQLSTAKSALDPLNGADLLECHTAATPGAIPVRAVELADGQTEITTNDLKWDLRQIVSALPVYSAANVSSPPTDAELDSAFGTPASVGRMVAILNDNGADTASWLVWSTGTAWFHVAGTLAM